MEVEKGKKESGAKSIERITMDVKVEKTTSEENNQGSALTKHNEEWNSSSGGKGKQPKERVAGKKNTKVTKENKDNGRKDNTASAVESSIKDNQEQQNNNEPANQCEERPIPKAAVGGSGQQSSAGAGVSEDRRSERRGLPQELRDRIKDNYDMRAVNLLIKYNKLGSQFADFSNNLAFLSRCATMSMVPASHRVYNNNIRNTRAVVRLLDQCSYRLMITDLEHNRRRKFQVRKNREKTESRLKDALSTEDFAEVQAICEENKERHFAEIKERQRKQFEDLMNEYKNSERSQRRETSSRRSESTNAATPEPNHNQGD